MSQLVAFTEPGTRTDSQLRTQQSSRSPAYDPVDKLRVSQPQSLIDTDFEYGQQPTKWESINLQNNRQGAYIIPQIISTINNSSSSFGIQTGNGTKLVRVWMANTSAYTANQTPIFVQGATNPNVNGWWLVTTVVASTYVEFYMDIAATVTTNTFNPGKTYVYPGFFYSNCGFSVPANCVQNGTTSPIITTNYPHGLNIGDYIYLVGFGGSNANGSWIVATIESTTSFTVSGLIGVTSGVTNSAGQVNVYMRPAGWVEPRPFDGGVAFSAGGTITNQQIIRQTRRYFRYQSGKGIQFSTGSAIQPTLFQPSLTASGTTVTVTTTTPHNLAVGTTVVVSGATPTQYNGTFLVTSVTSKLVFTYVTPILQTPPSTPAIGNSIRVNATLWYGAQNAIGFFDQQNGIFFQYDGQQLFAVVRSSTTQTLGYVQVTQGNATVTGVGTNFTTAFVPGQFAVIRGQSYRVIAIASDTSLTIAPEYRGATYDATNSPNGGYIMSVTIDTRYPRSTWFDPMDGTGPSGYTLDLTRMQMWYIDYSWYGAGSIRWGFRGKDGAVTYCHQVQNNNIQYEAFMRSGNLPAHYESSGLTPTTYLTASLASSNTTSMSVADTSAFNTSGLAKVSASGSAAGVEFITYTGKTATSLTGLTRGVAGGNAATNFTYSSQAFVTVEYATADSVPSISHWGSSAIMDGNFNDDKSLIFNYGMTVPLNATGAGSYALAAIRIAPSVDNGTTDTLGLKEIINRMQLQLDSVSVISSAVVLVNLILNGRLNGPFAGSGAQPTFISPQQLTNGFTSSLAQIAVNGSSGTTATITGGESLAAAYVNIGLTTLDLAGVRDLGNSILGGGVNNNVPTTQAGLYPDGPDILYVVVTTTGAANLQARLSWKEAQA
jgi:hypothetical protein